MIKYLGGKLLTPQNNNKRGNNMSIVAILNCKDGILALSDSKSTLNYKPEKNREVIPKIFSNEKCIFINFGTNRLEGVPIEDVMPNLLEKYDYYEIVEILKQKNSKTNDNIHFFTYDLLNDRITHLSLADKLEEFEKEIYIYGGIGGNEYYINVIKEILNNIETIQFYYNRTMEEMENLIKPSLEKVIKILDTTGFNNPCGLPLVIKKYKITGDFLDKKLIEQC